MSPIKVERLPAGSERRTPRMYPPDVLPLMQVLLKTLAEIDFHFQRDLETIEKSTIDRALKQRAIATLKMQHHERRAPYLLEIDRLEEQIMKTIAWDQD